MQDAVVVRKGCGATVVFYYHVYIVAKGNKYAGHPIFVVNRIQSMSVEWVTSETLLIMIESGDIQEKRDVWRSSIFGIGGNEVKIISKEVTSKHIKKKIDLRSGLQ